MPTVAEVLRRYEGGPQTGIFTDGGASPNPGPGGWGVVYVLNGEIQNEAYGYEEETTNNRMELTALIHAMQMIDTDTEVTIYSDSDLCVKTMNEWAPGWKARGWKRKSGPIKNLELVQELFALFEARPHVTLKWIKAHDGSKWNEYADALATAWMRESL